MPFTLQETERYLVSRSHQDEKSPAAGDDYHLRYPAERPQRHRAVAGADGRSI